MAIYVKAFVFVLFVYAISALPLDVQDEPQDVVVDLVSLEEVPEPGVQSTDNNDDLTRAKRHGEKLFINKFDR